MPADAREPSRAGSFSPPTNPPPGFAPNAPPPPAGPRIGEVSVTSWRGLVAVLLFAASLLGAFYGPLVLLVQFVFPREPAANPVITSDLLFLNLLYNAIVLLILPVIALALIRPGHGGDVAERLRLLVTSRTPRDALLGAGVTLVAMLALAGILYGLDKGGHFQAEESELVPQIQALLTWQLVIAMPIIAAVTEEVFFRGFLQPRVGLVASSLLFGFVHIGYGTVLQFVAPLLLGLLFGVLFQRTRSLWTAIAAHFTFDFVEFILLYQDKVASAA